MKICPWCEAGYPEELTSCPVHGGLLSEIRDLKPGMLVRNTYRILRKLSQGGMGNVYLAQHILLNEPQVLKFLSTELSRDHDWTSRFLREVRTLRQIRHKNVVNAGNLEPAEDGALFFSMEYVEGPDLMEFCRHAPKPFDVPLALQLTRGIAEGLGAAHAVGVVHRDIKPENILIAREAGTLVPKIADFGIVATREGSRLTQGGTALLTPQFAAPEQWLGAPTSDLDGRTDLYALGGVLFEMLTGRCAFDAENYHAWGLQHLNATPPLPSSLRPDLAEWQGLDRFILLLLAKNPDDRPRDVQATLALLDQIVHLAPRNIAPEAPQPPAPAAPEMQPADAPSPDPASGPAPAQALNGAPAADAAPPPAALVLSASASSDPAAAQAAPAAQAAQTAPPAQAAPAAIPRTRLTREPMPIWEPMQPRSSVRAHTFIRAIAPESSQPARPSHLLAWIAAFAVVVALGLAAWRISMNPVDSRVLLHQRAAIFAVAFAPDGLNLASASRDGTIQFWNAVDGRPLGAIAATVTSLAFSPVGHVLATGMSDYTINLWDAAHGLVLGTLQGHTGPVSAVAFSPDGRTLASASWDGTVRLWDVASGRLLRTLDGHSGYVFAVAFSPDGNTLASAGADRTIRLWDPANGIPLRTLRGHTAAVNSIAFSPDGRLLASGSGDLTLRLWDVASGLATRTLRGHTAPVLSVAFSPDGNTLASGSADNTVRLWDVNRGQLLRTLKGHTGPVFSVAFSPFGYIVASGSADQSIRLWEIASLRD